MLRKIAVRSLRSNARSACKPHTPARTLVSACQRRSMSSSANTSIGFIGLGNMGGHMARNLIKTGRQVVVFDVSQDALDRAKDAGAVTASTPADVARRSTTIVTMLPSPSHVEIVYQGEEGVLAGLIEGSLCIDSSTIDPTTSQAVAELVKASGGDMVDAPVSGGILGAEAGTLTFMVGGSQDAFERAKPFLQLMGKNVVHCGANGFGQVAKIANNLILGISMVAVAEGMNLGVKAGMDPKKLAEIINTSTGRCWSSDTYNPCPGVMENVPASRDYKGGFGVDLMRKDLGLAVTAAESCGADVPIGAAVEKLYSLHSAKGNGSKDFGSIYQYVAALGKSNK